MRSLSDDSLPAPRRATLRRLHTADGETVDEALVLWMPAPASFTGEDCVELHLHGGAAVVSSILELLQTLGLYPAGPGEFTRRAFENGRLDLSQAEAIGDLVEAESGAQRRQALAQLGGALSRRYEAWRVALLDALSLLEAQVDFPDEDVPEDVAQAATAPVQRVGAEIRSAVNETRGERVRQGFRIALIGAPNVGKSSLLNALSRRDAAIVTPVAGTTRDVIEVPLSFGGQLAILADTAGLHETSHEIEAEGVRRATAWAAAADLRIGVVDASRPETLRVVFDQIRPGDVLALNKSDLAPKPDLGLVSGVVVVKTVATLSGVDELHGYLASHLSAADAEFPAVTRLRHRALLEQALIHLERASGAQRLGAELVAEDVRLAIRSLEAVTGRTNPEAVLDRVFASFCIGK